jgi:hypothetical protein
VTVDIIVKAINDNPVAQPDSYGIAEDTPLKLDAALGLLRNDTDAGAIGIKSKTSAMHRITQLNCC